MPYGRPGRSHHLPNKNPEARLPLDFGLRYVEVTEQTPEELADRRREDRRNKIEFALVLIAFISTCASSTAVAHLINTSRGAW